MPTPLPDYPWQKVGSDLFELNGKPYLITVDYFSRYPEVTTLPSTSSLSVITALKSSFARYGIPEIVATDNGPQFSSQEFELFAREYNFHHQTSSPKVMARQKGG
jgi:transposase InsO family protein